LRSPVGLTSFSSQRVWSRDRFQRALSCSLKIIGKGPLF
jgi:hypothetical protein